MKSQRLSLITAIRDTHACYLLWKNFSLHWFVYALDCSNRTLHTVLLCHSQLSRIFTTWINSSSNKLPCGLRENSHNMPKLLREQYPTTRAIIDATEVFIQQPSLPELQQRTFSNYKNHHTFKALIGISPSGAVIFVSKLYPGNGFTHQSGLLDLLEDGNSIMADRGFDIMEDLEPRGVKLNIHPFLHGKNQLDYCELIET